MRCGILTYFRFLYLWYLLAITNLFWPDTYEKNPQIAQSQEQFKTDCLNEASQEVAKQEKWPCLAAVVAYFSRCYSIVTGDGCKRRTVLARLA